MKRYLFSVVFILITISASYCQPLSRPRLVIGIVVDQMRPDYIPRYWNKFGNDGFRKLYNEGYNCRNTQYNYIPTHTAPGHASIYTGTTPMFHGIVGNDWYDRSVYKMAYCTGDSIVSCTGCTGKEGKMSPRNLRTSTITDELKIAMQGKSKVIGISLKDRGSILPAGHAADAAYWYEGANGNFISSTWYIDTLPVWVNEFNERRWPDQYLSKPWTTLLPVETYTESDPDNSPYEENFSNEQQPVFPHPIHQMEGGYGRLREIPAGNTYVKDFALAAIKGENLGKDSITDFLCVSFSSTDYIGHRFTIHSVEIEDTYLRLDRDIADLLNFLDKQIGRNNYLLFLTADHGAMENPTFMKDKKIPAGTTSLSALRDSVRNFLAQNFGSDKYYLSMYNDQIYLDHVALKNDKHDRCNLSLKLADYIKSTFKIYQDVLTGCQLEQNEYNELYRDKLQKGYFPYRCGDICIMQSPNYIDKLYDSQGTRGIKHYSSYPYDAHVPLFWMGWNIPMGSTVREISITDIAPTLSLLLNIPFPNASIGKPVIEIFK